MAKLKPDIALMYISGVQSLGGRKCVVKFRASAVADDAALPNPEHLDRRITLCGYAAPLISGVWVCLSNLGQVAGFYTGMESTSKQLGRQKL